MKSEQLYKALKDLMEKFGIKVAEHNLRNSGIKVKSGLCKVKGKFLFILDKHKSISDKIDILVSYQHKLPHEDVYVVPALREFLDAEKKRKIGVIAKAQNFQDSSNAKRL